jgi:hypothetical protein
MFGPGLEYICNQEVKMRVLFFATVWTLSGVMIDNYVNNQSVAMVAFGVVMSATTCLLWTL